MLYQSYRKHFLTLFQLMGHAWCLLAGSESGRDRLHLDGYLLANL